jgi:formate/nitrite transporter FocA (FNT family)
MMDREERRTETRQGRPDDEHHIGFSDQDIEDIEESSRLRAPVIYEILRREGEEEMQRPVTSLWWSGVAAGLSISFSLLTQAVLQLHLPNAPWRPLLTGFGYSTGFLLVVLARQQLFTENTLTAVLPVAGSLTFRNLARLGRLWGIVLAANVTGTLVAALFCSFTPVLSTELREAMLAIAGEMMENRPIEMLLKAISAGYLIAAMVWLIPSAGSAQFLVITLLTYIISIAGFAHIVAGSFEAFMLVIAGRLDAAQMIAGFGLPTFVGNVIGGTVLFALVSYAQVAKEVPDYALSSADSI